MRAAIRFGKLNRLKYLAHLDLQRFMQRALNRTNLPIAFSQGFSPHPIMCFASALAMGWESEYEVLDVKLVSEVEPERALGSMRAALPEDMPVYAFRRLDDKHPALPALVKMAQYTVVPAQNYLALRDAAEVFLSKSSVRAIRKTKSGEREIDIRPLAYALEAREGALYMRLALTEADTLKPDVLMGALNDIAGITERAPNRILRTRLLSIDAAGNPVPLMEL